MTQNWKSLVEARRWDDAATLATHENGQAITPVLLANRYLYIGQQARATGDRNAAIKYFELAIPILDAEHLHIAHSWTSECYSELGLQTPARHHFSQSMQARHQLAYASYPNKMAVAFSLFGSLPEYCEYAVLNVDLFPGFYPHATLLIYHDDSVPAHVLERLQKPHVELVHVQPAQASHMPGTFWRFLALADPRFDIVLVRDIDSFPTQREAILVSEWLQSGKPFHVIRDWFSHSDLILAGLWGARSGLLAGIRQWIDLYLQETPELHPTHADQNFLAKWVWPRIYPHALHHSWLNDNLSATWPEQLPPVEKNTLALGAFLLTHISPNIPPPYRFTIRQGQKTICSYEINRPDGFTLPTPYIHKMNSGEFQLEIVPLTPQIVRETS